VVVLEEDVERRRIGHLRSPAIGIRLSAVGRKPVAERQCSL